MLNVKIHVRMVPDGCQGHLLGMDGHLDLLQVTSISWTNEQLQWHAGFRKSSRMNLTMYSTCLTQLTAIAIANLTSNTSTHMTTNHMWSKCSPRFMRIYAQKKDAPGGWYGYRAPEDQNTISCPCVRVRKTYIIICTRVHTGGLAVCQDGTRIPTQNTVVRLLAVDRLAAEQNHRLFASRHCFA